MDESHAGILSGLGAKHAVVGVLGAAILAVGAFFLAEYLRFEPVMLARVAVAGLLLAAVAVLARQPKPTKAEIAVFAVFSALFDLSLVLGYHIVISDGDAYSGLADANYISAYTMVDAIAFVFMLAVILPLCLAAYSLIKNGVPSKDRRGGARISAAPAARISWKAVLLFAAALFVAWLPYLAVYFPGFVFGDTVNSFKQLMGISPLRNRHPVLYTLFIGGCLDAANFFGFDNTAGCALYCLIQMTIMAACFSYLANWVVSRTGVSGKARWAIFILFFAYFGVSPYIATYTIAMWKDPLFSSALVMLTLFLADAVVFDRGREGRTVWAGLACFAFFALIVAFFRNNEVYVLVLTAVVLALWLALAGRHASPGEKKGKASAARRDAKGMLSILLAVSVMFFLVTGPLFNSLGIKRASNVEAFGIPINQMARVATLGGDMSASDREYLDAVLPLELYPETYRPCCTDLLKWDGSFESTALGDGFVQHWVSMLLKNPVMYFEAWELQTFGFWTVNQPQVYEFNNIAGGAPKNNTEQLASYGIDQDAGIQNEAMRELFPSDEGSIPIGAIFWLLLLLAASMCLEGRARWLVVLVPSFGLLATLLVATPIWYWPRYAAAVQFLLPFYICMFYLLYYRRRKREALQVAENAGE